MLGVVGIYTLFLKFWDSGKSEDTIRSNSEAIMRSEFLNFELDSVTEWILDHLHGERSSLCMEQKEQGNAQWLEGRIMGLSLTYQIPIWSPTFPASITVIVNYMTKSGLQRL